MRSFPTKGTSKAESQDSLTALMNDAKESVEHATFVGDILTGKGEGLLSALAAIALLAEHLTII